MYMEPPYNLVALLWVRMELVIRLFSPLMNTAPPDAFAYEYSSLESAIVE